MKKIKKHPGNTLSQSHFLDLPLRSSSHKGFVNRITKSRLLNIPIANLNYHGFVNQITYWANKREHRFIGVCNVHSITSAAWTPQLKEALLKADLNTADGIPLVWAQKLLGHRKASRVYGPTLMLHTLERAEKNNLRVAFYGGHPERLPILLENLRKRFPKLNIVEAISPPFRPLTHKEDQEFTQRLIDSQAQIIWVGIGCPKQETWMLEHSPKIQGVMIGVGAAFDFHAGAIKQSPAYLQKIGLEWAYRLYCEPRRLFLRYLTTNPIFLLRMAVQLTSKFFLKHNYICPHKDRYSRTKNGIKEFN